MKAHQAAFSRTSLSLLLLLLLCSVQSNRASAQDSAAAPAPTPTPTAEADSQQAAPAPAPGQIEAAPAPTAVPPPSTSTPPAEPVPASEPAAPALDAQVAATAEPGAAGDEDISDLSGMSLEDLLALPTQVTSYVVRGERQPVSRTVISREQIALSSARTLQDVLLTYVPGYFMVEDQDDVIAGFRGFSPDNNSKVMLLINGRNMNTEWFMGPGDAILNGIDLDFIERIEVIRGPGSVLLGQGSLLGVINIVTRDDAKSSYGTVTAHAGTDDYHRMSAQSSLVTPRAQAWVYGSVSSYGGQKLRKDGWSLEQEDPPGVRVLDRDHRLRQSDQNVVLGTFRGYGLELQALHFDQMRDNYNFYRDRERHHHELNGVSLAYTQEFTDKITAKIRGSLDVDEFGYFSHSGLRMAGTREDRYGLFGLLTWDDLFPNNRLAIGGEIRRFAMGKQDRFGLNLIVNNTPDRVDATNTSNRYINRTDLDVYSVFLEDAWSYKDLFSLFGGLRMDVHPFWGSHASPRVGTIVTPVENYSARLSFQTGFRGAPGQNYTGGWRRDGFLEEDNFDQIEGNPLVVATNSEFKNQRRTEPESIRSLELELMAEPTKGLKLNAVVFANWLTDLIDVGVIYAGDNQDFVNAPDDQRFIGTDQAGDWNGWWYFKNNEKTITSMGSELSANYTHEYFDLGASHSLVRVLNVPTALVNSMYVTGTKGSPHFKAYPEQVTRLNAVLRPIARLSVALNLLYFPSWYSPAWDGKGKADGDPGLVLNGAARYAFDSGVALALSGRNLLGRKGLWPMNSNAGGPDVSPGTPALEAPSGWLTCSYTLQ